MTLDDVFPRAPGYGQGVARRRIRLIGADWAVRAELEDGSHGMRCAVAHDGHFVQALTAEFIRVPMTTCAGAGDPLGELVGLPIGCDFQHFFAEGRARRNCTHMFDLAWLAVAHAARGTSVREYAIDVSDEVAGVSTAKLWRNDILLLDWSIDNGVVQVTGVMNGANILQGFTRTALEHFSGDDLEALMVLQKAYMVARHRRYALGHGPLAQHEIDLTEGVCYGYAQPRVHQAVRLAGTVRDFTHRPDRLLKFE